MSEINIEELFECEKFCEVNPNEEKLKIICRKLKDASNKIKKFKKISANCNLLITNCERIINNKTLEKIINRVNLEELNKRLEYIMSITIHKLLEADQDYISAVKLAIDSSTVLIHESNNITVETLFDNSEISIDKLFDIMDYNNPQQRQNFLEFDNEIMDTLKKNLGLLETELPNLIPETSSLNDGLNGDAPVTFNTKSGVYQIIHSQAKLKREYMSTYSNFFKNFTKKKLKGLKKLKAECSGQNTVVVNFNKSKLPRCPVNIGIVSRMNAIRAEETKDATHSYSVRQFEFCTKVKSKCTDEEKIKTLINFLYLLVPNILNLVLPEENSFAIIHSKNFFEKYEGNLTVENFEEKRNEFEMELSKKYNCFVIIGIGKSNSENKLLPYDNRSPDYDDHNCNCDIFVRHKTLNRPIEICSMGYRVDPESLRKQLSDAGITNFTDYHKNILDNKYIQTLGGGIGIDRLRMCRFDLEEISQSNPNV